MMKTSFAVAVLLSISLLIPTARAQETEGSQGGTKIRSADVFDGPTIEFFSMTQIKPNGKTPGGPGGHADIYIKGMCKDYTKAYPALIPCKDVKSFPPGLEHNGVGISIDNDFVTTGFVVVPGHELFVHGPKVIGKLDDEEIERLIKEATRLRIFEGVKVKESLVSSALPPDQYLREVIKNAIGTDIAMRYGRSLVGVEMRSNESVLQNIADYANKFNKPFVTLQKPYTWSGTYGNCAHLSAGILFQACIRNGIPSWQPWYKQIFNLALPRNGLSTLQTLVHRGGRTFIQELFSNGKSGIEFESIRKNELWWGLLKEGKTLPVGLGAISTDYPTYKGDGLYADDLKVSRLPHKILGANQFSDNVLKNPAFTDLDYNLVFWGKIYEKAWFASLAKWMTTQDPTEKAERKLYHEWVGREIQAYRNAMNVMTLGACEVRTNPAINPATGEI